LCRQPLVAGFSQPCLDEIPVYPAEVDTKGLMLHHLPPWCLKWLQTTGIPEISQNELKKPLICAAVSGMSRAAPPPGVIAGGVWQRAARSAALRAHLGSCHAPRVSSLTLPKSRITACWENQGRLHLAELLGPGSTGQDFALVPQFPVCKTGIRTPSHITDLCSGLTCQNCRALS